MRSKNNIRALAILVLVCVVYLLVPFHRMTPSVMAEPIMTETGMTASMMGLLSSVLFLTFGIMQMVDGMLVDYYGPRKMLPLFISLASLGTALFAVSSSYAGLVVGRALIGFGSSIIFIAGLKLFSTWFPPSVYGRLNGLLLGMGGLGLILGSGLMGYLCEMLGWRDANFAIGVITLIFAVLLAVIVRDAPAVPADRGSPAGTQGMETRINPFTSVLAIMRNREYWLIAGWFCCQFSLHNAFGGLWGGQYLRQVHHLDTVAAGNVLNMLGVGTLLGAVVNAWACDKLFRSPRPMMVVSAVVYLLLFGCLLCWGERFPIAALHVWFFLLAFFGMGSLSAGFACMPGIFGRGLVGTASGLLNTLPSIAVLLLQPLTGVVLEMIGGVKAIYSAHEYALAFSMYFAGSAFSLFCAFKALRWKTPGKAHAGQRTAMSQ